MTEQQLRKFNGTRDETVDMLIETLDHMNSGVLKWEARIRSAIANGETGQHTLRVIVESGVVRKVTHTVQHDM